MATEVIEDRQEQNAERLEREDSVQDDDVIVDNESAIQTPSASPQTPSNAFTPSRPPRKARARATLSSQNAHVSSEKSRKAGKAHNQSPAQTPKPKPKPRHMDQKRMEPDERLTPSSENTSWVVSIRRKSSEIKNNPLTLRK